MTSMYRSRRPWPRFTTTAPRGDQVADEVVEGAGKADAGLAGAQHVHLAAAERERLVVDPQRRALAADTPFERGDGIGGGEAGGRDGERVRAQLAAAVADEPLVVLEPRHGGTDPRQDGSTSVRARWNSRPG